MKLGVNEKQQISSSIIVRIFLTNHCGKIRHAVDPLVRKCVHRNNHVVPVTDSPERWRNDSRHKRRALRKKQALGCRYQWQTESPGAIQLVSHESHRGKSAADLERSKQQSINALNRQIQVPIGRAQDAAP